MPQNKLNKSKIESLKLVNFLVTELFIVLIDSSQVMPVYVSKFVIIYSVNENIIILHAHACMRHTHTHTFSTLERS